MVLSKSPPARWGATAAATSTMVYVFGGFLDYSDGQWQASNELWAFNPVTNRWNTTATKTSGDTPPARGLASSLVIDNTLYLLGGCGSASTFMSRVNRCNQSLADLWALNLTTLTWTQVSTSGVSPNGTNSLVLIDDTSFLVYYQINYATFTTTFDIPTSTWTTVPLIDESSVPDGRFGATLLQVEDQEYLLYGGLTASFEASGVSLKILIISGSVSGTFFQDSWILSLEASIWTDVPGISIPSSRYLMSGSVVNESVLIFGLCQVFDQGR